MNDLFNDICDYNGHEWVPMGGGMEICMICEREREDPDVSALHVSIVCAQCGDSTPLRCRQRGCPLAAANLRKTEAYLRTTKAP